MNILSFTINLQLKFTVNIATQYRLLGGRLRDGGVLVLCGEGRCIV